MPSESEFWQSKGRCRLDEFAAFGCAVKGYQDGIGISDGVLSLGVNYEDSHD